MSRPSMTVVIPSYQRREAVVTLVRAIERQALDDPAIGRDLDIVVVLDGSTDGSAEALRALASASHCTSSGSTTPDSRPHATAGSPLPPARWYGSSTTTCCPETGCSRATAQRMIDVCTTCSWDRACFLLNRKNRSIQQGLGRPLVLAARAGRCRVHRRARFLREHEWSRRGVRTTRWLRRALRRLGW